ncbi:MAG TPA: restriction endonuclease [Acidimicrobiales bacterium]|nr:restriction endonuclease [Acidimicrobiales bacterium]
MKVVSPAVLHRLREALSLAYWFKTDLRSFLATALPESQLVPQLDWADYKRNIVRQLVDTLASQPKYQEQLVDLILATADIGDPVHLRRLTGGEEKYANAKAALDALDAQVEPYRRLRNDAEQAERRRLEEQARAELRRAVSEKLGELQQLLFQLTGHEPQQRGYDLEKLLNELFALFDIDARGPFRVVGEQIDGAFSHEGTEFLFEAKWQKGPAPPSDIDVFAGKVGRKLENTLGLFLSMEGYQPTAVDFYSQRGSSIILMEGADLAAVLEDRIPLPELITRKRQHASSTGQVLLRAYEILR